MLSGARRGCLVTTACLGNVGVLACALGRLFHPIHVIVDALAHPFLRAWQQDLFRQPGVKIVERSGSAGAIPRLLESGQAVLIIAETERRRGSAVEVDFLGRSVRLYPTLGRLAAWYDVPVVVVSCLRCDEPFRFVVRLHGIIRREMCEGDDAVIRETMARLESAVADHPAQYLWSLPTLGAIRARNERQAFGRRTPRQPQASGLKPQAYAYGNLIGVVPQ
jgi:lauroyl/myristoyl acyltransferase